MELDEATNCEIDSYRLYFQRTKIEGGNHMGLRPCPSCRNDVSRQAEFCPNCGHTFVSSKKSGMGITFWGVVGAVILGIIIMSYC